MATMSPAHNGALLKRAVASCWKCLQVPEGMPPKARRYLNSGTYIGRAQAIQAVLVR